MVLDATPRLAAPVDSCDEGKPRCQRCIDGDFECRYGSRLTFLEKNVLTVTSTSNAGDASTPRYPRLQFVNPASPSQTPEAPSSPSPVSQTPLRLSIATNATDTSACLSPLQTQTRIVSAFQIETRLSDPVVLKPQPLEPNLAPPFHHPLPLTQWRSQSIGSIGHEGLVSPAGKFYVAEKSSSLEPLPSHGSGSYAVAGDGFGVSPPDSAGERRAPAATLAVTTANVSPDRLLQLLRHFRYQLDMCDMSQTFGLHVPRLAIEHEDVLHSLLTVAAVTQQADMRSAAFGDIEYLKSLAVARPMYAEGVGMSDSDIVRLALWATCQFASDGPNGWQDLLGAIGDRFWSEALAGANPKTIAILSVLVRLELAAALVAGAQNSVPEQLHFDNASQPSDSSPVAEAMFRCAVEPLLLCAQVVNFCAGTSRSHTAVGPGIPPTTPVHRWTVLCDALGAWYAKRNRNFRPMAEMDGDEGLFPVVLFTSGAAVLANQLYHTAMLMLLHNKPRTLQTAAAAAAKKSSVASLSPLWHAQRVCGIALNNDRRDSWDPCLVASLYLAARRMTYEPQQRAILECFERVGALTG
ncbi:hypothetical protein LZ31DRAFT_567574 [Colletotrichum somersetense]|nr:hypothetical protein LZ31DRAFT_567574 [Colletotrichum somersetense]